MLLDYMCSDYEGRYNIKLAEMFGLNVAVYLNEIMNLHSKAKRKNKLLEGGLLSISREYVKSRTTLSESEQRAADDILNKFQIIVPSFGNPDVVKYNVECLEGLLRDGSEDYSYKVKDIVDDMYISKEDKRRKKATGREITAQRTINDRMKVIKTSDPVLVAAYRDWIESVVIAKSGKNFTDVDVNNLQLLLDQRCKDDTEYKIAVLKDITANKYVTAYDSVFNRCLASVKAQRETKYDWA